MFQLRFARKFLAFIASLTLLNSIGIAATYYKAIDSDLIGQIQYHTITAGDTWFKIAYHYDLGHDELRAVNPHIQNLKSHLGKTLIIPTQFILPAKQLRNGIVVNLAEKRLYFFFSPEIVITYPVSVGRDGWKTPSFAGRVIRKDVAPTWHVPKSILAYYKNKYGQDHPATVPPGPKNPLGNYVIRLNKPGILIHGTSNDTTIGKEISSGCIRMYNRNISELYHLLDQKPRVHFIHEDEKLGIDGTDIYYEKNSPYDQDDNKKISELIVSIIESGHEVAIDKTIVDKTYQFNRGIPTKIGYIKSDATVTVETATEQSASLEANQLMANPSTNEDSDLVIIQG